MMWDGRRNRTSNQLRDEWGRYVLGWWKYFQLAEAPDTIFRLEGWIPARRLGVHPRLLPTVRTGRGAWFVAATSTMNAALQSRTLHRFGFLMPSNLAAQ